MTHSTLPNHLTLTGRPLLLLPSVLNELHARLQEAYTPKTARLSDRLFRRAESQKPPTDIPAAAAPALAGRIKLGASHSEPAVIQPDPYLAVVTIEGPLLNKAAMFGETVCIDGYDRIEAAIADAMRDHDCLGILLDIDSPGGMVNGCFELSDKIGLWAQEKPIVAHTSALMCSAAYAIASQCTEIHAALTAITGSIGVIYGRYDWTGALEQDGIKIDYITSGTQKSWGHPDTVMSEAEEAALQDEINTLAEMFFARVAAGRNLTPEQVKDFEAGAFLTEKSVDLKIVDSLTDTAGALSRLMTLTSDPKPIPAAPETKQGPEPARSGQKPVPASTSTKTKETPMSKSIARHRASLAVLLLATASTIAFSMPAAAELEEDKLKQALRAEADQAVETMEDEDVEAMEDDEDVNAMEDDDDIEAMDEDELEAIEEEDEPEAKVAFHAKATRVAQAAIAAATPAPAKTPSSDTGDPVADALADDKARRQAIKDLPEAKGRELLAADLADEGMSVEGAKRILGRNPKASKRQFNAPSPKVGASTKRKSDRSPTQDLIAAAEKIAKPAT